MALTRIGTSGYTTLDATKLTGNLPAISGARLTGISAGISGAAGKYTFYASLAVDSMTADKNVYVAFYKNGSHAQSGNNTPSVSTTISSSISASFDLSESDYIEVYSFQSSGGSKNYIGNSTTECLFYGYKQLGV